MNFRLAFRLSHVDRLRPVFHPFILCCCIFIRWWFDSIHFDCVTGMLETRLWNTFMDFSFWRFSTFWDFLLLCYVFQFVLLLGQCQLVFSYSTWSHCIRTSYALSSDSTLAIHDDDLAFVWCFDIFPPLRLFSLLLMLMRDRKRDFHI